MAIALSDLPLLGQPVMVKPSEAGKNPVQSTTAVAGASAYRFLFQKGPEGCMLGNCITTLLIH